MRDKCCGNCEHFAVSEKECRAHPPVTVIIQPSQYVQVDSWSQWPMVNSDHWCGEFNVVMTGPVPTEKEK